MRYARIVDSKVVEVIETPVGFGIEQCLVPALAAQCVPCSTDVQQSWTYDGVDFISPEPVIIDAEIIEG